MKTIDCTACRNFTGSKTLLMFGCSAGHTEREPDRYLTRDAGLGQVLTEAELAQVRAVEQLLDGLVPRSRKPQSLRTNSNTTHERPERLR